MTIRKENLQCDRLEIFRGLITLYCMEFKLRSRDMIIVVVQNEIMGLRC